MNLMIMATVVKVCLFGGSSVLTSYLPDEFKHHVVLEQELSRAYPEQKIQVKNFADNGEFIARYLLRGAYERHRQEMEGVDVAIIRFGTNDMKRMQEEEYRRQLEKFIALLEEDFPGVRIILETGMYVDYPAHYLSDRNKSLDPIWQVSRDVAKEKNYPLADYNAAVKTETAAGNWDMRIRRQEKGKPVVIDASQDAGKENDPRWFNDIHPNPEGVRIAVREEVRTLRETFPEALPSGQQAKKREARSAEDYAAYLDFAPERLERQRATAAKDQLQDATQ